MDALKFLEQQHDEAKSVFKKLEKAEGSEARRLWQQLSNMLTLHEEIEETHFYPPLKEAPQAHELILESYEEHHVLDVLIGEINQLEPSNEQFHAKLSVLQENTEHHIEEEEKELFPKVRKIWDTAKREEVGKRMEQMGEERQKRKRAA